MTPHEEAQARRDFALVALTACWAVVVTLLLFAAGHIMAGVWATWACIGLWCVAAAEAATLPEPPEGEP